MAEINAEGHKKLQNIIKAGRQTLLIHIVNIGTQGIKQGILKKVGHKDHAIIFLLFQYERKFQLLSRLQKS